MSIDTLGRLPKRWNTCIVDVEQNGYVYSLSLMVSLLTNENDHWTEADALEWIDYNIIGFYINGAPISPIIIDDYNHELKDLVYIGEEQ